MPPPGFDWRPFSDGQALFLGTVQVANLAPLDGGRVRACLNVNNPRALRYEFLANEPTAIAYVEAWARKWEGEIRDGV